MKKKLITTDNISPEDFELFQKFMQFMHAAENQESSEHDNISNTEESSSDILSDNSSHDDITNTAANTDANDDNNTRPQSRNVKIIRPTKTGNNPQSNPTKQKLARIENVGRRTKTRSMNEILPGHQNLFRDDALLDKKLRGNNRIVPRTRETIMLEIPCNTCGKLKIVHPNETYLDDDGNYVYRCNDCIANMKDTTK